MNLNNFKKNFMLKAVILVLLSILICIQSVNAAELSEKTKQIIEASVNNVSYTVTYTGKMNEKDTDGYTTVIKFNFKDADNYAIETVESTSFLSGKGREVSLNGEYWTYNPDMKDAIVTHKTNEYMAKYKNVLKYMCDDRDKFEISESKSENLIKVILKSTLVKTTYIFTIDPQTSSIIEFSSKNDDIGAECKGEFSGWNSGVDEQAFEKPSGVKTVSSDEVK